MSIIKKNLNTSSSSKKFDSFDLFHKNISVENLNKFRLQIFNNINKSSKFRLNFFNLFKEYLDIIVGNELAMQKKINLSIQLPKDTSSLLPIHSDVWSGDSPFEIVTWLPFVDVYKTKSMYILPPKHLNKLHEIFKLKKTPSSEQIYKKLKKYLIWLDIKFGEALFFNQILPHGNVVNLENETRWSMNCRFKGIYTPYGDKKIGEFFDPVTLKPISKLAIKYKLPKIND